MSTKQDNSPSCNLHPDAPHGFDRNASHSLDRYVCECEGWTPPVNEDCYGMTSEERIAFETNASRVNGQWVGAGEDDRFVVLQVHLDALIWAACAKLNREKLIEEKHMQSCFIEYTDALADYVKHLEAENERLKSQLKGSK